MPDPVEWLIENSGPVVRWRTAVELGFDQSPVCELEQQLVNHPPVREWLGRLNFQGLPAGLDSLDATSLRILGGMVHGSKPVCLENVYGKLAEFGLRAGIVDLDERPRPMAIFRWKPDWQEDLLYRNAWETLVKSVFAWGLLRLGYQPDTAMEDFLLRHLETCHKFARDQVYDIYASESELLGLPKAWAGKQILKPEVMANYWLPYIHDLYMFANFPQRLRNETTRRMISELIDTILSPRFQQLREGYGYAWIKERRTCYGWGWSPHFKRDAAFLQRLELLAHFKCAQSSQLFRDAVSYMETFALDNGRYQFPPEFLRESAGYYVSGFGMGLGENRRTTGWREIESTFRAMKVKALLETPVI